MRKAKIVANERINMLYATELAEDVDVQYNWSRYQPDGSSLDVKRSNHGWGVFVAKGVSFHEGDVATEYCGKRITDTQSAVLRATKRDHYIAAIPKQKHNKITAIDGFMYDAIVTAKCGVGSMVNDPLGSGRQANVVLYASRHVAGLVGRDLRLFLLVIRDIHSGDELLLDYMGAGGLQYLD